MQHLPRPHMDSAYDHEHACRTRAELPQDEAELDLAPPRLSRSAVEHRVHEKPPDRSLERRMQVLEKQFIDMTLRQPMAHSRFDLQSAHVQRQTGIDPTQLTEDSFQSYAMLLGLLAGSGVIFP